MASSGTGRFGGGRLADIERLEREVHQARQAFQETTGSAESADGLIQAQVSGPGEVAGLVLDARVYREYDPLELAEEIRTVVNQARTTATKDAFAAFVQSLPSADLPDGDDAAFGPLLDELARLRKARPR